MPILFGKRQAFNKQPSSKSNKLLCMQNKFKIGCCRKDNLLDLINSN